MSYCLNPDCMNPKNVPQTKACQACKTPLLLRDRYRASKILGKGGFGTTFLAKDEGLPGQPDCVIKQLKPVLNTPQYVEQCKKLFQREAETMGKISSHPQVPRLLDFFEVGQEFYLVQEYISGNTLQQEVKRDGPLAEMQVKDVLKEVLPILDYLHQQEVVHRDIKPPNIIRRSIDNKLILIDFGVVNDQAGGDQGAIGSRAVDIVVGTKGFAAPEQLAKRSVYASDIYGLGMTCVFLLVGRLPKDLEANQAEQPWWNALNISPQFKQILRKMVALEVQNRYGTASSVLQDLEQVAATPVPTAAPTIQSQERPTSPQQWPTRPAVTPPSPQASPTRQTRPAPSQSSAHSTPQTGQSSVEVSPQPPAKSTPKKKGWLSNITGLVSLPTVSEQVIAEHQQAINSMTTLMRKVKKLDSPQLADQKFIEFAKIQNYLTQAEDRQNSLMQAAQLLKAGIDARDAFAKIEATESRDLGADAQNIYRWVQSLLEQNPKSNLFLTTFKRQAADLSANIKSEKVRAAMQIYLAQIEQLAQDPSCFQLLSLFTQSQERDYSVLQVTGSLLESHHTGTGDDIDSLTRQVRVQYTLFEKLGRVIGIPAQKRVPETYAYLIQYVALSDQYQPYYSQFRQILVLLETWHRHYKSAIDIRQKFSPSDYKIPKDFKETVPGIEVYERYTSSMA
ncbi:MAG: protein kinase [Thermosynechococcaceae cyanobacterium]